jgi:hypothetical protein
MLSNVIHGSGVRIGVRWGLVANVRTNTDWEELLAATRPRANTAMLDRTQRIP